LKVNNNKSHSNLKVNNNKSHSNLKINNNKSHSNLKINNNTSQVKNYGPVPAGKHQKSLERGSSIPTGKFSDFFR
jgi:hypothetical protein